LSQGLKLEREFFRSDADAVVTDDRVDEDFVLTHQKRKAGMSCNPRHVS